ncbi:MAG: hypothetical protein Q7K29_09660 [Thermoleophilia bacterium]|nr:hypothetical protein [Thermoleophilia bacterium]
MSGKTRNFLSVPLALLTAISLLTAVAPISLSATTGSAATEVYTGNDPLPPAADTPPAAPAVDVTSGSENPGVSTVIDKLPVYSSTPDAVISLQLVTMADTTAPLITGYSPANDAITGSSVAISASFYDPDPSVGIKLSTGMIHVDNRHQPGTVVTESGISNLKSGLTEGQHKLEAFICDNNYNCSVATWYINVDTTAPVISNAQPTGTINSTSATIAASFTDGAGTGVDVTSANVVIDGVNIDSSCGISADGVSCDSGVLAEGNHDLQVEVYDLAGYRAVRNWSFSVDLAAIAITGQTPAHNSWQTSASPSIEAVFHQAGSGLIDTSSITMLLDGVDVSADAGRSSGGIVFLPTSQLSQGGHTMIVALRDDLGHEGRCEWSFTVDSLAPQILNQTPSGTAGNQPTISALMADTGSGIDSASVNLTVDGINATDSSDVTVNQVTYIPPESLTPGPHSVQLAVRDLAGNQQTSAWNFSVSQPPAPSRPAITPPVAGQMTVAEYWQSYSSISGPEGNWIISGFMAFPSTYYLPWYDSGQTNGPVKDELVIRNDGAGSAIVNVLLGGKVKWQGKVEEGASETIHIPETTGGPVKIICPSGQPLEVTHRLTGENGFVSETPALADTDMESVLLLPWYETRSTDEGSSSLVIANAGSVDASVDVYVGDPEKPESLKGHYNIGPDSAARTVLADTSGGPLRIISTNNQPLLAEVQLVNRDTISETIATGISHVADSFKFEATNSSTHRASKLMVGNGSDRDLRIEVRIGDELLRDPENTDNDFFTIPRQGFESIALNPAPGKSVEIICTDCMYGEGLVVSRF